MFVILQTGNGPAGGHGATVLQQHVVMDLKLVVDHVITQPLPHLGITVLVMQRMWLGVMMGTVQVFSVYKYLYNIFII